MPTARFFVWLDLEMTGLDPAIHRIIEIATLITDPDLNIVAEGPVFAIDQPEAHLAQMDEWNTRQHNQSGLVARVQSSSTSAEAAEQSTLAFIKDYVDRGESPLCGNSIGQDRRFLRRYMPELANYFHYRNLDVSTLKILAEHWAPTLAQSVEKSSQHLALEDIKDSVHELKHYRDHWLKLDP